MRRWSLLVLLISSSLAARPHLGMKSGGGFFKRYDLNGDSVVTREEFDQKNSELFARFDQNGDGRITRKEFWQNLIKRRFQRLDLDGDGQISWTEFLRVHQERLKRRLDSSTP